MCSFIQLHRIVFYSFIFMVFVFGALWFIHVVCVWYTSRFVFGCSSCCLFVLIHFRKHLVSGFSRLRLFHKRGSFSRRVCFSFRLASVFLSGSRLYCPKSNYDARLANSSMSSVVISLLYRSAPAVLSFQLLVSCAENICAKNGSFFYDPMLTYYYYFCGGSVSLLM